MHLAITNFLQEGALLRHQDQWILVEGPFTEKSFHNPSETTVYVTDFYDLNSDKQWVGAKTHILSDGDFKSLLRQTLQKTDTAQAPLASADWQEPEKETFFLAFQQIQKRLQQGEIQKAVPVVFAETSQTVTAQDRLLMLTHLTEAPRSLFVYGFWKEGRGFLGATPETLFEFQSGVLKTMALAGTCPKEDAVSRTSLLEDPKEMHEHLLVVDDLKQELQGLGDLKISKPYVLELPTLYHLRTDFLLASEQSPDFMSLVRKLHPTPALGVAPRSSGWQWMKDLPGQEERRTYGAPFGIFQGLQGVCLVGIRNIQWDRSTARIGSGCGIVAASELEREWRELAQKRQSVRKILGLSL